MISEEKIKESLFRDPTGYEARRLMARYNLGSEGLLERRSPKWGFCGICGEKTQKIEHVLCREHVLLCKQKYLSNLGIHIRRWKNCSQEQEVVTRCKTNLLLAVRSVLRSATHFYLKGLNK